jgi:Domain of unknown function (DUF4397)
MNLHRFLILGVAVGSVVACSSDNISPTVFTQGPQAWIHIINSVPDTGAMDFRFTDVVEGVPNVEFVNLPFRGGTNVGYKSVSVGSHHIRVFMDASNLNAAGLTNDPAIVSTVMGDTTFTFADGAHYTFIFYGKSRSAAQKFLILTDNFTSPTGISLRAVNMDTTAVDFYVTSSATVLTAVTGPPTFANQATATATAYTAFTVASSSGGWAVTATAAGAVTPLRSTLLMATGSAAVAEVTGVSGALAALPGSRIAGSIFTAVLFRASVSGSKAASFTTPGIVMVPDRFF